MRIQRFLAGGYEQFMKDQISERKVHDNLGLKYLDKVDLEICNYVLDQLFLIDVDKINLGDEISVDELVDIALNELDKMGGSVSLDAKKNIYAKPLVKVDNDHSLQMTTSISYGVNDNGDVLEDSAKFLYFFIPEKLYEVSGYFFGHEQLHALKDINYSEYVNQRTLGEVIPIFFEFMIYSPKETMKKELLKVRMGNIFDNAFNFELFDVAFRENRFNEIILGEDEESIRKSKVYEYVRTKMGCYLNSFYYALILYNMYKQTPKKILDMVSKVLIHEMTTMEMLKQLGIYGDIKGEVFESELQNVKRLIR